MNTELINQTISRIVGSDRNYAGCLNDMHEAEKMLVAWIDPRNEANRIWGDTYGRYIGLLVKITESRFFMGKDDSTELQKLMSATAAQRAEAFLRALSLWK